MALIEVDEHELANLRAAVPSQRILKLLEKDPKHRRAVLEMVKEADPSVSIPEIDAGRPALAATEAIAKEFAEFRAGIEKDRSERETREREGSTASRIDKERGKLRAKGYGDEGIAAVEKLMTERGLADYEAAEALFDRLQPDEEAIIPNYDRSWNMFAPDDGDDTSKLLVSGVNGARKWQSDQIQKFFREKREGKLRL